jgi:hypothetical protein
MVRNSVISRCLPCKSARRFPIIYMLHTNVYLLNFLIAPHGKSCRFYAIIQGSSWIYTNYKTGKRWFTVALLNASTILRHKASMCSFSTC